MQASVTELVWTQYVGFGVLLGGIFLSAMAIWSWTRVCAGHLRACRALLAQIASGPSRPRASDTEVIAEALRAQHDQQREDQAEREIYRLGEKLRAQSREDLLRAQREEAGCSLGHENCGTAGKIRWDEAEQALTSRPERAEAPSQQAPSQDQAPETTAAPLTAVPGSTPALCADKTCIWFGKFDHVWHLLPGQEGDMDE